jgi:hypothetical protein
MRFSIDACERLMELYESGITKPSKQLREELALELGKTPRSIQIWFQNKRAKAKRNPSASPENRNIAGDRNLLRLNIGAAQQFDSSHDVLSPFLITPTTLRNALPPMSAPADSQRKFSYPSPEDKSKVLYDIYEQPPQSAISFVSSGDVKRFAFDFDFDIPGEQNRMPNFYPTNANANFGSNVNSIAGQNSSMIGGGQMPLMHSLSANPSTPTANGQFQFPPNSSVPATPISPVNASNPFQFRTLNSADGRGITPMSRYGNLGKRPSMLAVSNQELIPTQEPSSIPEECFEDPTKFVQWLNT